MYHFITVLPDYIYGKFYNGFPDDWENVYQIWRTYVSQGCPVIFRWPTPITDSDDDLKSEMTDLTYTCVKNKKSIPATERILNECTKTENRNDSFKKKEKYQNYSTHSSHNYEKNTSFIKPSISNSEKDIIPVVQTNHVKSLCNKDNKQSIETVDVNPPSSSRKINKLKDILQEDKLNIIMNNLADRNCSPKYISKIIEMFDCLDYVVSYRTESECNNDSVVSASCEAYDSEAIPQQQNLMCDDNVNTNKLENKWTELKNYGHSTDLGYGSIRNDATQLSNPVNVKSKHDMDSDKSESETYAGVPKISVERVLKAREMSRKMYKRRVRKKTVHPDASKHTSNLPYNAEEVGSVDVNSVTNTKKHSISDESCISITEDEMEKTSNTREYRKTINTQKSQEIFSGHQEMQKNNFDMYEGDKFITHVQNKQPLASEAQKVNLNVFIKEQKIPCKKIQEFVEDVKYTPNSDIDVVTVSTNSKTGRSMIGSHAKMDQDMIISKNNNFPEKSRTRSPSPKLRREFVEQTKSEIVTKKSKPTIISLLPVNLNLKISRSNLKTEQSHNSKVIVNNEDKQNANIRSVEETDKKKSMSKTMTSVATKPAINNSPLKTMTVEIDNNKREICPITNNKNKSDNINSNINSTTNSTTKEQPKSNKLGVEENPKVLTTWTPKVVYYAKSKSELGLTFQGKLLK